MHTQIGGRKNEKKGAIITVPGEQVPESHGILVYISKEFEVPVDADGPKLINNRQNRAIVLPEDYSYFVHFTGENLHLQAEILVSDTNESYYEFERVYAPEIHSIKPIKISQ